MFLIEVKERQRRTRLHWLADALREVASGQAVVHDDQLDQLVDAWISVVLQLLCLESRLEATAEASSEPPSMHSSTYIHEMTHDMDICGAGLVDAAFIDSCKADPYAAATLGVMTSTHITRRAQRDLIALQHKVGTPRAYMLPNEHRTKSIEIASDRLSEQQFQLSSVAAASPQKRPLGYTVAVTPTLVALLCFIERSKSALFPDGSTVEMRITGDGYDPSTAVTLTRFGMSVATDEYVHDPKDVGHIALQGW